MNQKIYREPPVSDEIWVHFKGLKVEIISVGMHTETQEKLVVYRHADDNDTQIWIRPLEMFMSEIDHNKYPDVKSRWRFERLITPID